MRMIIPLVLPLLLPLGGIRADAPKWMVGDYVTYTATFGQDGWEAVVLRIEAFQDGVWGVSAKIRDDGGVVLVRMRIPQNPAKGENPVQPLNWERVEGPPLQEKEYHRYVVRLMNLLNVRNLAARADAALLSSSDRTARCGVGGFTRFEDKWPEFGYTLFHDLHAAVPITGVVGTTHSKGSYELTLTSFGRSTPNIALYEFMPTSIDFSEMRQFQYGLLLATHPSTWFLFKTRSQIPGEEADIYVTQMGGNIHAGFFLLKLHDKTQAADLVKIKRERLSAAEKDQFSTTFGRDLTTPADKKKGLSIVERELTIQGQVGRQLFAVLHDETTGQLIEMTAFVNYGAGNPDRIGLPERVERFLEIMRSVRTRAREESKAGTK